MTPDRWRQIEDLYHAAQSCGPTERAALLERTDPEIRLRVERMLKVESGSQLLDPLAGGLLADPTRTVIATGAQLGPYKIEAQIGAGGMGTVYRATDTRLGRVVAIKIAAERYSERFQLEAQAISTLNHPHVCTLYDVGPNYLVMEFIEGSTLAAELKKGPLVPEVAARYGAQIAGALAEAHSLGIVHRDLKPSNVMLTRHGIKVLDFGLAKMLSTTGLTEPGCMMGTPAYMAPEQVEGREPSASADLFALGLVLYEMAVGKLPFPGASLGQMLSSRPNTTVPRLSEQRADLPPVLDRLVTKLLEKDPAKRPLSALEVERELTAIADRLSARPSPSLLRPAIAAIILLILLVAGGVWFYQRSQQRQWAREEAIPEINRLCPKHAASGVPRVAKGREDSARRPATHVHRKVSHQPDCGRIVTLRRHGGNPGLSNPQRRLAIFRRYSALGRANSQRLLSLESFEARSRAGSRCAVHRGQNAVRAIPGWNRRRHGSRSERDRRPVYRFCRICSLSICPPTISTSLK